MSLVARTRCRSNRCAKVFCQLNCKGAIPPEPAGMKIFWPGRSPARSFNACHDVRLTIGREAACTKSRFAGFMAAAFSGTTANSAREPVPISKMLAKISSPGVKRVTRLPTAMTTPDRSLPNVAGSLKCRTGLNIPVLFGVYHQL